MTEEECKTYELGATQAGKAGIPEFWKTAIINSNQFPENKKDQELLSHLKTITLDYLEDQKSKKVTMEFEPNDYFDHSTLTISYNINTEDTVTSKVSDTIVWKDAKKNPTVKLVKIKKKGKTEVTYKQKPVQSFFSIFTTPNDDSPIENHLTPEEEMEYFWDTLVPNCLEYYLGIADDDDDENAVYI
jgi:hypothetical protein